MNEKTREIYSRGILKIGFDSSLNYVADWTF